MKPATDKHYMLGVLLAILAFNLVDRLALGVLLQDIKSDLGLSDTQLGLLTGIAFALFYSLMGIPIARWADRGNRVTIVALTTALWSAAVAMCGMAGGFLHLLLIRIGVAVGEAGCVPPAHSLIADHFSRAERPRAVSRYMLGGPLSAVIGYFLAGWLNEFYGWRTTFLILGLPGLGLAALAWLTLTDPRATGPRPQPESAAAAPGQTIASVFTSLWANRTFRHLLLCAAVMSFFSYGIVQWQPAFLIRTYGLETGELGTWLAMIEGIGGVLGIAWGGEAASRLAANNERLQLMGMAAVYASLGLISPFIYLAPNRYVSFGLMGVAAVGMNASTGPLFATIQTLVPQHMRAMSIAILYLCANLVGMGLGPLAAGALSDALQPLAGEQSLRYALLALCPGYLWGAWHLWHGSRTVAGDLEAVQVGSERRTAREAQLGSAGKADAAVT